MKFIFSQNLKGKAQEYYYGMLDREELTLDQVTTRLKNRFEKPKMTQMTAMQQLQSCIQEDDESLDDFAARIRVLVKIGNPGPLMETTAMSLFLTNMSRKYKTYAAYEVYKDAMAGCYTNCMQLITATRVTCGVF